MESTKQRLIWENQRHSLITYTLDVPKDNVKQAKILWTITEPCLNPEFPQEQLKIYHARKICVSLHGPTTWTAMPRNVWNDIVSWRTKRLNNSTKYQLLALTTIISKKKNGNQWENCQKVCSQIHHTWEYKQYCHVGNTAKQCRLGLFQDPDFAGDLEDSKSTSGGTLCFFRKPYGCSNQLDV